MRNLPDYKKIYVDMITMKYPDKMYLCENILRKEQISVLDVIHINNLLESSNEEARRFNQKLKSYDRTTIFEILDYQTRHKLNNSEIARHFKLSRNTITKWRKMFFSGGLRKEN